MINEKEAILCGICHGSGEGMYDGSTCQYCKGQGLELEREEWI